MVASPRRSPPTALAAVAAALAVGAPTARARAAGEGTAAELTAGRAQAMGGAHRGDGRDNETLLLNPAGMALRPRYSVDLTYGYLGGGHLHEVATSVVDSKSSPLAAGLRATRAWGDPSGLDLGLYRLALGSAMAIGEHLAVGAVLKNHRGHWRPDGGEAGEDMSLWTGSLGVMARAMGRLTVGAVWENLARPGAHQQVLVRPSVAAGVGLDLGRLSLAADGRIDLRAGASRTPDLAAGVEVLALPNVACRAGYLTDQLLLGAARRQAVTFGLALTSQAAGLHVGAERAIAGGRAWAVFTGLRLAV